MTINLTNKIQQVAFNRMIVGNSFELRCTYEQNIEDEVFTSVLVPVYAGARWSVMETDFTAIEMHNGQAHYRLFADGNEILNGRMNINL